MVAQYIGIQSGTINIFRGQEQFILFTPQDQDGNPITVPGGTTGTLVVCTSLSPDTPSALVTFTDLYESGGQLRKDFSQADTRSLPLGTMLFEARTTLDPDPEQIFMQGSINVYQTQMG